MPGLNRKGPNGEGTLTGRRMGRCNPDNKGKTVEEFLQSRNSSTPTEQVEGRGQGRGQGLGKGLGLGRGMGKRLGGNA